MKRVLFNLDHLALCVGCGLNDLTELPQWDSPLILILTECFCLKYFVSSRSQSV